MIRLWGGVHICLYMSKNAFVFRKTLFKKKKKIRREFQIEKKSEIRTCLKKHDCNQAYCEISGQMSLTLTKKYIMCSLWSSQAVSDQTKMLMLKCCWSFLIV